MVELGVLHGVLGVHGLGRGGHHVVLAREHALAREVVPDANRTVVLREGGDDGSL